VRIRCGPAAVNRDKSRITTGKPGRTGICMICESEYFKDIKYTPFSRGEENGEFV